MISLDTNLKTQAATTQYLNFDFNSMVKFEGRFFCASENGLYEITGSDDDGEDINSYFEPVTMDFGISNEKRLRAAYIGYEANGDLTLTVSTDLGLSDSYTIPASAFGQHAKKVVISRKVHGRYWTFQISGDGVIFSIDSFKVLPIYRGHGFNEN